MGILGQWCGPVKSKIRAELKFLNTVIIGLSRFRPPVTRLFGAMVRRVAALPVPAG